MLNDLLILFATLILLVEIYRKLRQIWLQHLLTQKRKAKRALRAQRKPPVLRLKSERDCRFCQEDKRKHKILECEGPISWQLRKGKGGPKKKIATAGYFCPNETCEYYGISDEETHALVGYGMQVGGRSQEMAFSVIHELKSRLAVGCVPVFSPDGLKHYYYALTAHFGKWKWTDGKKPVWVLLGDFVYSQVIKHRRRWKMVEVERRVLVGEVVAYRRVEKTRFDPFQAPRFTRAYRA